MRAGGLDRRILIETPTTSRDALGGVIETWAASMVVWARARPLSARERFASDAVRESKVTVFTTRFFPQITVQDRIRFDPNGGVIDLLALQSGGVAMGSGSLRTYRILGIAEIGRREGLEIAAELFE